MEFGTSKEIELLDSSEGDPSVSEARQQQNLKPVDNEQTNTAGTFMPPVTSASSKKRPGVVQVNKSNDPSSYKMPPINSFTSLGRQQLNIDGEDLEENSTSKGQTPIVNASNQQFELPPQPEALKQELRQSYEGYDDTEVPKHVSSQENTPDIRIQE